VCRINIFKFVTEDLLNSEHNSHNLEMYGMLRKQTQGKILPNEITDSDGSLGSFVGARPRPVGGEQKNDGSISSRDKDAFLQSTQNRMPPKWAPFRLESVLITWV
jgi:hypothetical protein